MEKKLTAEWETGAEFVYRVREGDTLAALAERFCSTFQLLAADNRLFREVEPGDLLLVRPHPGRRHRVMPADTPRTLSRKYGVPAEEILRENAVPYLYVGMDIIIRTK